MQDLLKPHNFVEVARNISGHIKVVEADGSLGEVAITTYRMCFAAHLCLTADLLSAGSKSNLNSFKGLVLRGARSYEHSVRAYTLYFKELGDCFYREVEHGPDILKKELLAVSPFKRGTIGRPEQEFWRSILRLLLSEVEGSSYSFVNDISQYLNFAARLRVDDLSLRESAIDDYLSAEAEMRTWTYPSVYEEQLVIKEWLEGIDLSQLRPKNGPGAGRLTKKRKHALEKYANFNVPEDEEWFLFLYGIEDHLISSNLTVCDYMSEELSSKLVCVPKTAMKMRTIGAEPEYFQWMQHGVLDAVLTHLEQRKRKGLNSPNINSDDQERSRRACLEGSISGSIATFDLSAASDSVTLRLVTEMFSLVPEYLEPCLRYRARRVFIPYWDYEHDRASDHDGLYVTIEKYAGMGSGLTFINMELILGAIIEAIIRRIPSRSARRRLRRMVQIVGDDLIVPMEIAAAVRQRLEELHFTVNTKKTFDEQNQWIFREACGMEAWNGIPVIPCRFPRGFECPQGDVEEGNVFSTKPYMVRPQEVKDPYIRMRNKLRAERKGSGKPKKAKPRFSPVHVQRLCDMANEAFYRGFDTLRAFYLDQIRAYCGDKRYFAILRWPIYATTPPPASTFLLTWDIYASNYGCKTRWNADYQRLEYQVWDVTSAAGQFDIDSDWLDLYLFSMLCEAEYSLEGQMRPVRAPSGAYLLNKDKKHQSRVEKYLVSRKVLHHRPNEVDESKFAVDFAKAGLMRLSKRWVSF